MIDRRLSKYTGCVKGNGQEVLLIAFFCVMRLGKEGNRYETCGMRK